MSGFWRTADESESETENSSSDESIGEVPSRFMRDSDSEDEGKREVKSKKDSRFDNLQIIIRNITNAMKINDFCSIQTEFDNLLKAILKAKNIFNQTGIPTFLIGLFVELEDYVKTVHETYKGNKKKDLSSINAKSLSALRQKLRKNNELELYKDKIEEFRASNGKMDEEAEAEEEAEVEEEEKVTETKRKHLFDQDTKITYDTINKKLLDIASVRGKRGTDSSDVINVLTQLADAVTTENLGPAMLCKVLIALISAQFDSVSSVVAYMDAKLWNKTLENLNSVLDIVIENSIDVLPNTADSEVYAVDEAHPRLRVSGDFVSFVERLDSELLKHLQAIDPHTTEYVVRLKDELSLFKIIVRVQKFVEQIGGVSDKCRIYIRRIDHMYYKPTIVLERVHEALSLEQYDGEDGLDQSKLITSLCKYLYSSDDTHRIRTRAILSHVYHLALHDRWFEARDLMLMSHLQETIQHADVETQILFNRMMVQLGLCAFRSGRIEDAHSCLHDINCSGRTKELLAQGLMNVRFNEKNLEQEKIDKRRQMPFHMHINIELLECVYLVCAMLLEIPNMALNQFDHKRRVISKSFRRLFDISNRQIFNGPPENTRDHVITAAKMLLDGNWRECSELILELPIWNLIGDSQNVKTMLLSKIQEEGLRTYIFNFGNVYDTILLSELASRFELPDNRAHSIVSKMMINEEILASWDQPTASIIMHRQDPTRLQHLSMMFAEKGSFFVENNERFLEIRSGGYNAQRRGNQQFDGSNRRNFQANRGKGRGGRGRGGIGRGGHYVEGANYSNTTRVY